VSIDLKICFAKCSALGTFMMPSDFFHSSRFMIAFGASCRKFFLRYSISLEE